MARKRASKEEEPEVVHYATAAELDDYGAHYQGSLIFNGDQSKYDWEKVGRRSAINLLGGQTPTDLDPQQKIDLLLGCFELILETNRENPERFKDPEVVDAIDVLLEDLHHLVGLVDPDDLREAIEVVHKHAA